MSKLEKKITRLKDQIAKTEAELLVALSKKSHSATEVSVSTLTTRIQKLNVDLAALLK